MLWRGRRPLLSLIGLMAAAAGCQALTWQPVAAPVAHVSPTTSPCEGVVGCSATPSLPNPTEVDRLTATPTTRPATPTPNPTATPSPTPYPRPPIIPRSNWCFHPDCETGEPLVYWPISHLVIHHTVSPNTVRDWPTHVRAIWNDHAFNRGWRDIAYNYLIDPAGHIYEGHRGGPGVVGHMTGGENSGQGIASIALLGDFNAAPPSPAMLDALVALLTWQAQQHGLDPYGAARLAHLNWGTPIISGHRDIYGSTQCPGAQLHAQLPALRDEVAARLGRPALAIISPTVAGGAPGPEGCGWTQTTWLNRTTPDPEQAAIVATWRADLPRAGRYRVRLFIPACHQAEAPVTRDARYTLYPADGRQVHTVSVDQAAQAGLWVDLGTYFLEAGVQTVLTLDHSSSTPNAWLWIDVAQWEWMGGTEGDSTMRDAAGRGVQ